MFMAVAFAALRLLQRAWARSKVTRGWCGPV